MKIKTKRSFTLFLAALVLTGATACGKPEPKSSESKSSELKTESEIVTTSEVTETPALEEPSAAKDENQATDGAFQAVVLIKIGEHTYYQEGMFDDGGRNEKFKDYMISQLEKADKDLHDDVYVTGIGEAEQKGEFRFFGKMMNDGVTYDSADMTCWYDDETKSNAWSIDYSKFRRTEFSKNGLIPAEDVFEKVYERASQSDKVRQSADEITGTYLLAVDSTGTLYYRFTINRYSTVDVDAKTGEIIFERYWNGIYT